MELLETWWLQQRRTWPGLGDGSHQELVPVLEDGTAASRDTQHQSEGNSTNFCQLDYWLPWLHELPCCKTPSSYERSEAFQKFVFQQRYTDCFGIPSYHLLGFRRSFFFFHFFVNCYKLLRLVPLLLMVFTTTDSISFCKRH